MPETSSEPERPKSPTTRRREEAAETILAACRQRFAEDDFEVRADEKGTVWVKRTDTRRSVGLEPWLLRDHSAEEVLERAVRKLGL